MRFLAAGARDRAQGTPHKSETLQTATKMESLGSSMAMTRKVLRFGRPIGITINIIKALQELASGKIINTPKAIFKVLGDISLLLFFLFDHYLYFERVQNHVNLRSVWQITQLAEPTPTTSPIFSGCLSASLVFSKTLLTILR